MNPPDVDTWYVLVDGTKAHPADVSRDDAGILKHSNGVPVAMRESGLPLTTGDANRENAMAAEAGKGGGAGAAGGGMTDMTIAQLKELAAERGVDLGDATKKADIVAVLSAAPAAKDREVKPGESGATYQTR